MKRIILTIILLNCLSIFQTIGQISALQSKSGETSILIPGGGISVNSGDSKISASFGFGKGPGDKILSYGVNSSFKTTEGVASLFEGRTFKAQFDVNPFVVYTFGDIRKLEAPVYNVFFSSGYKRAKYNVLKQVGKTEFENKTFNGINFTAGLNSFGSIGGIKSSYVYGISFSALSRNNADINLKPVDQYNVNSSISGNQSVNLLREKKGGFEGNYIESFGGRINLDAYLFPPIVEKRNIGFGGFARVFKGKEFQTSSFGGGLVIGNPMESNVVVLGFFYQFSNTLANDLGDKKNTLSITAGYNF